jgi:hypothetical protein
MYNSDDTTNSSNQTQNDSQIDPGQNKIDNFKIYLLVFSALIVIIIIILLLFTFNNQKANIEKSNTVSSTKSNSNNISSSITKSGKYLILSSQALNWVASNNQSLESLKNYTIFVTVSSKIKLLPQTNKLKLIYTKDYTNEEKLANSIDNLSHNIKAVLYDNEPWSLTPVTQQENIVSYYQKASNLAHSHGLILISTPVINRHKNSSSYIINTFSQIAKVSNVFDIQSQYDQALESEYSSHVISIAEALSNASPNTIILSGLSTNPRAGIPTPLELVNDAKSVSKYVQGYWLNIPLKPSNCSEIRHSNDGRCKGPQPQIAIEFLIQFNNS